MDLDGSDEQALFRYSIHQVLADIVAGGPDENPGMSAAQWRAFADLGWLALALPEDAGGLGQGAVETGILMEGLGRSALRTPYLSAIVLAGGLIARLARVPEQREQLRRIAAGDLRVAFAHDERTGTTAARASRTTNGWTLSGEKVRVIDLTSADDLLVSAAIDGDIARVALFLVSLDAAGLTIRPHPTIDGSSFGDVQLADVSVSAEQCYEMDGPSVEAIDSVTDVAVIASCSELVGLMSALFDQTRDYTATRHQFGKPIAANQAVRHRLVDMAVACEEARAITLRAAIIADDGDPLATAMAASAAKAKVGPAARVVAEEAVQLHGAMGVTEELPVGRMLKRILSLQPYLGSPAHHLDRHARLRRLRSA